jgi:hypothetical protein
MTSALDDSNYTLPDSKGTGLTTAETKRLTQKTNELRDSLGQTCKHLVKPPANAKPWKRAKRKWSKEAWRQYLDGHGGPVLDDALAVMPAELIDDADAAEPQDEQEVACAPDP